MLEKLTEKQEEILELVFQEYDKALATPRPPENHTDDIKKWLDIVYKIYGQKTPERIEIVDSPMAAFKLCDELTGKKETELDWCGVADSGWVAFYDYFERIGVHTRAENKDVIALREFQRCIWDTLLLDEAAILIRYPAIKRDSEGNLHSAEGPSIRWEDGNEDFSWHGVWVPRRIIEAPRSFTKEEFLAIQNTEVRRALGEHAGWDFILGILGAAVADTWKDDVTGLTYELLASTDMKWIRKQSPALQNGQQPAYVEPVSSDLKTARAARKWQATELSVIECERDPHLTYRFET